jgi:2-methylcitrate dehydratase
LSSAEQSAIARLAERAATVRLQDFSEKSAEQAKLILLDTLGCGFVALHDECANAVLATVQAFGEAPHCTLIGRAQRASAPSAVLANGTLIRVLDLNDYVVGADPVSGARGGHPSDNIPVALAAAELSDAGGPDLLAAILLGYEIYGRGKTLMDAHSPWDGISISGLAAPAMAGRLLRLPREQLAHAIALGAARAPTPVGVREGAISAAKSIANALIAQNGMQAALLAAQGVTGPLDLFEAERGLRLIFAHRPDTAADILGAPLPADGFIGNIAVKAFPCFAGAQSAVAAALALHRQVGGDIGRLEGKIRVMLADLPIVRRQMSDPGRVKPQSREAADHSLQYLIAVALIDGSFGLKQFEGERWTDPQVVALMERLDMTTDSELARRASRFYPCAMQATDRSGATHEVEVLRPPGVSPDGLDAAGITEKFARLTEEALTPRQRDRIVDAVMNLDTASRCDQLIQMLAADAHASLTKR